MKGAYRIHRTFFEGIEYKMFYDMYVEQGHIDIKFHDTLAKIYSPELALMFTKAAIPTTQQGTKVETELKNYHLLEIYIRGFSQGVSDFNSRFDMGPNVLYGENGKEAIKDIHMNYHHIQHANIFEGWKGVKGKYPILISEKQLNSFGYFSGIVSRVDELRGTYPALFSKYDRCTPDVEIGIKGLATFLYHRSDFSAPPKHHVEAWRSILVTYHVGDFTPKSLAKVYYDMNKSSNRINVKSDKNLQDALVLFALFPDPKGVKNLEAELKAQKKGTLPK